MFYARPRVSDGETQDRLLRQHQGGMNLYLSKGVLAKTKRPKYMDIFKTSAPRSRRVRAMLKLS